VVRCGSSRTLRGQEGGATMGKKKKDKKKKGKKKK